MKKPVTITLEGDVKLSPDQVLEAAHDFSFERRPKVFNAVQRRYLTVHWLDETTADVTEGTRYAGPFVNWERCRYDWSRPGSVLATVIDSNVYAFPGSCWELRATPSGNGSHVVMIWTRIFQRNLKGRIFGFLFPRIGQKVFGTYARQILDAMQAEYGQEVLSNVPERE